MTWLHLAFILILLYLFLNSYETFVPSPTVPDPNMKSSLSPVSSSVKVAIVSTVRDPHQLKTWICYHLGIGIDKIYLIFDRSDDPFIKDAQSYGDRVKIIINDSQWKDQLSKTSNYKQFGNTVNSEVMSRQILNAEAVLRLAETEGFDWVIHIDSDELIHLPYLSRIQDLYQDQPSDVQVVHITNFEVAPLTANAKNCFREHTLFRNRVGKAYKAYYGTKSSARANEFNFPKGVHHFTTKKPMAKSITLDSSQAVILHYINCNFDEWLRKYQILGDFKDKWWGWKPIKIPFHTKSRDLVNKPCKADKATCEKKLRDFYHDEMLLNERTPVSEWLSTGKLSQIDKVNSILRKNQC